MDKYYIQKYKKRKKKKHMQSNETLKRLQNKVANIVYFQYKMTNYLQNYIYFSLYIKS